VSSPDTRPRIALRPADNEARQAVVILAGYALAPLPAKHPRLILLDADLEFGREGALTTSTTDFEDTLLSRRHARVVHGAGDSYFLEDLGSTNGTWLDGIRIVAGTQHLLKDGAVFLLGGQVFVFRRVTHEERQALREAEADPFAPVPTLSPSMALFARKLRRLAPAKVDLLLAGEPGLGKQLQARAIHKASGRTGPFLTLDCAATPEHLFESELFGEAAGAMSGEAVSGEASSTPPSRAGLLEQAEGGTLFLDEIDAVPAAMQTRLRRFLQNRQLTVAGTRPRRVDVRVVAATSRPGGLHDELGAHLGPAPLLLPPLRDRVEDLGPLVDFLAGDHLDCVRMSFVPEAYLALFLHSWKGNVPELEKAVTVAQVLADGEPHVDLDHLPTPVAARVEGAAPASRRRRRPTREELVEALARHGGDVAELARELGRQRTLVWRWLRENEIRAHDFRN
jgi:DNA-binding NtrC family response regulator